MNQLLSWRVSHSIIAHSQTFFHYSYISLTKAHLPTNMLQKNRRKAKSRNSYINPASSGYQGYSDDLKRVLRSSGTWMSSSGYPLLVGQGKSCEAGLQLLVCLRELLS
jgi:hypothetical protein